MPTIPNPKGPGRRTAGEREAVRATLLETARRLFAERDYQAVSVRTLAHEAGVAPAMINYYFGNKEGLYLAVLSEALAPTLERLAGLQAQGRHDSQALSELLQGHMAILLREPWLPPLVAREVLLKPGPLQETFSQQVAGQVVGGLMGLVADSPAGRAGGAPFAALSVLALLIFPFLARDLVQQLYGITPDDEFARRWGEHILRLHYGSEQPPLPTDAGNTPPGDRP